ncbi:hypothetical protein P8452_56265 [Trifolium repens]|nr:hypothetical protein P8452_56265 [Trifolium repens]
MLPPSSPANLAVGPPLQTDVTTGPFSAAISFPTLRARRRRREGKEGKSQNSILRKSLRNKFFRIYDPDFIGEFDEEDSDEYDDDTELDDDAQVDDHVDANSEEFEFEDSDYDEDWNWTNILPA